MSVVIAKIIKRENTAIPITNPLLSKIVGDSMTWNAVYFIPEDIERINKHDMWVKPNYADIPTAYINAAIFSAKLDAHELMHIRQYEERKKTGTFYSLSFMEFQALAFALPYDAYSDNLSSIHRVT